jgi:hypothetical protein
MIGKRAGKWGALAVLLGLALAPGTSLAGPYLGDWTWLWHPAADCPRGEYCPLHYWTPGLYQARACVHPSNLDQYPPGPCPAVPPSFIDTKVPCRSQPSMPSSPYSDPAGYYGRPVAP